MNVRECPGLSALGEDQSGSRWEGCGNVRDRRVSVRDALSKDPPKGSKREREGQRDMYACRGPFLRWQLPATKSYRISGRRGYKNEGTRGYNEADTPVLDHCPNPVTTLRWESTNNNISIVARTISYVSPFHLIVSKIPCKFPLTFFLPPPKPFYKT
jgi:hypothetical protein